MAISTLLILFTLLPGQAGLTGTWTLDRVRSEFGGAGVPQQFVVNTEQSGNHLAVTIFNADANGQRVSYRECRIEASGSLTCPDGVDETWQLTSANELTITRVLTLRSQAVRQRFVLTRSAVLD